MSAIKSFDQITSVDIHRYSTGFKGLDEIYGSSVIDGYTYFGLPVGQISLWAGAGGVGKTRMAIEIALRINATGSRVLFYQNEVTPSAFKSWVKKPVTDPKNFFVDNYSSLAEQIKGVMDLKPNVVVVDSINMLDGFTNPTVLRQMLIDYREAITSTRTHAIFISHLNKEGKVKGNNDITYLVDTVASLTKFEGAINPITKGPDNSVFKLDIGKNRYGLSGGWAAFKHVDEGVIYVANSFNKLQSNQVQNTLESNTPLKSRKGEMVNGKWCDWGQMINGKWVPDFPNDPYPPGVIADVAEKNSTFNKINKGEDTVLFAWIKKIFK